MEKAKLEEFNPWWINEKVDLELALPFKREIFPEVKRRLKQRFVLALTGLRRTGKTTILYQLITELIQDKISPTNIMFFSFDDVSSGITEVINGYKEFQLKNFREERCYIFFDEIQKYKNWENELKLYYDLYPKLKFIISGSESLFIRKKTKETLAGRIFEFNLAPFTFKEFLKLNKVPESDFKYETKMQPLFVKYALRGGFPETFSLESEHDFKEYIRSLVIDKIVFKDIPKLFKIGDPEFLGVLLELAATNPGMYLDYQSLSGQFGKDRRVIKDYVFYLKESYLISLLGNYRKSSTATLRKKKRIYPRDNALSFLYKSKPDEVFFGKLVESLVVNTLRARSFWKNGTEIDIIYNDVPIEVKYQEKINPEDFKPLKDFMRKFSQKEAILITKKEEKEINLAEGKIKLIPAWKFALLEKV